jgi:RimJ/RimL family protein N-acetyltransferase
MIWWPTEVPTLSHGLITLRAPQERDIPEIFEGAQDPIIPIFTRIPSNYSMANAEFYVRERSPNTFANQTELQLAVEYGNGDDAQFAGAFSFHSMDLREHVAEIGYWLTAPMRGKGIGSAATKLLTQFGFESIGFERIEAVVNIENLASRKLLERSGYTLEGIMRKKSRKEDGAQLDMALYAAIRDEWKGT